ncbi:tRNA glutamyl-Q(34) synthetase GluQRS [Lucifera butyrica]|nr:tRNA glutamyl-Q(34) synthetase GluQRS [Lucifera butyrica]
MSEIKNQQEPMLRGRFAPSPTGEMHLGNAWTALLAWLQVRAARGTMVLRLEDLDPDRSRPEYGAGLMDDLTWLGLDWDEGPDRGGLYGPYRQSQRRHLYQQALEQLAAAGLIYPCYCTRAQLAASAPHAGSGERIYSGLCRRRPPVSGDEGLHPALRLVVPSGTISFTDGVRGLIRQDVQRETGDFVVRRSDGIHAYQLAVVVDDAAMKITAVLRGDDLLSSTPRQLLLYKLLQLSLPAFTHVPLLISEDGHRLSKRQRDLSITALRRRGVKATAIIGYLAWKAGLIEKRQPVMPSDLVAGFTLSGIPAGPVIVERDLTF